MAFDQASTRHKQCHPTIALDLANDKAVHYLATLLRQPGQAFYVHATPPRGTTHKREQRLRHSLRQEGFKKIRKLRSAQYPNGLPTLQHSDLARVAAANRIFANIAAVLEIAAGAGAFISLGDSKHSYFWDTQCVQHLSEAIPLVEVSFQNCMHGGRQDRWMTFKTNAHWLRPLAAVCDGQHRHLPYKTGHHGDYPPMLCARIAAAARVAALQLGAQAITATVAKKRRVEPWSMAAAGRQPRGNRVPELISEFLEVLEVPWTLPWSTSDACPRLLTAHERSHFGLRQEAKLLSCVEVGNQADNSKAWAAKIGVYRSPSQFLEQAVSQKHPFDESFMVDDDVKRNIFLLLSEGVDETNRKRQEALDYFAARKAQLSFQEAEIHAHLDEASAKIVEDKSFLLFQEMCQAAGIVDDDLATMQIVGSALHGKSCSCSLFQAEENEPAMTTEQLMKSSKWSRPMLLSRSNSSVDAATVEAVWRVTLDEVSRGWLEGPLTEAEVQAKFGTLFVASPRFGLHQSDKVRPIDDMSVSLVNCSFAAQYRLEMDGVDSISVLARTFLEAVKDTGTVEVPLSTGCVLKAPLHRSLTVPEARRLMGRTLDLDSAYKQLLVKRSSLWCRVLLVPDAQGAKHYFVSRVMPFGAASAVYAFNKISRSIFKVGSKLFGLIWSNYYDDYPQLDLQSAGRSSQNVAETFLELIGWRYSTKPAKRLPMARTFQALGVEYSFEESLQGTIVVRNKPSRVERIVADIDLLLSKGSFTSAEASSLRGRLQFAESQTFGRVLALRMKMCNSRAAGSLPGNFINEAIRAELEWARSFVSSSPPRLLQAGVAKQTFLIFTDAALEGNDRDGSVGMVAYRLQNQEIVEKWFFSEQVPKDTMRLLQHRTPKIIATLELLASFLAIELLKEEISQRRCFVFIDNEAARASLISMYSPVVTHAKILHRLSDLTLECSMFLWICRVPSPSNPADKPSRLEIEHLVQNGFTRLIPSWRDVS